MLQQPCRTATTDPPTTDAPLLPYADGNGPSLRPFSYLSLTASLPPPGPQTYARYANLLSGSEPVESCLHDYFAEYLNAEVVLATVRNLDTATQWLRTTFLYVRVSWGPMAGGGEGCTQEQARMCE
jgi:hypothetical protein